MENSLYSNLGNRLNKNLRFKRDSEMLTLKDFIENKWSISSKDEFKATFVRDLKSLLNKENLFDLIQGFFDLESLVSLALEKIETEEFFSFDDFYKTLSPVLMRAILEQAQQSDHSEVILSSIKESIRIAIEEQIYQLEV
jgi:CRISPR/Cas system endoribonuclease Cas6 (RAMP superfamily)